MGVTYLTVRTQDEVSDPFLDPDLWVPGGGKKDSGVGAKSLPYTVTAELRGGLEERRYPASSWVCNKVTPDGTEEQNTKLFWPLFNYIQGKNVDKKKIPMTTPVTTTPSRGGKLEMCFYLTGRGPHPEPTDSNVYLKNEGQRNIVTRKVGGFMNKDKWIKEAKELKKVVEEQGISVVSDRVYMVGYDAPFKFWDRRNEVWLLKA